MRPDEAVRLLTSPLASFDALSLRRLARQWRRGRTGLVPVTLAEQLAEAVNERGWLERTEPSPEDGVCATASSVALFSLPRSIMFSSRMPLMPWSEP